MKFRKFSRNISWPVDMNIYANEWVDDVIASQFSIHFEHRNEEKKKSYFSCENIRLALIPLWIHVDAE